MPVPSPFCTRSFRYQWPADLATAWALEMEIIILGWYVLVESGSVVLLTWFGALLYVGTLLSPMMGTLGDRLGLRRLLSAMRLSYALLAATIGLLAYTQQLSPERVLVVALLVGLIKPSDIGMRTALVSASVPADQLASAMGISRTTQDSARVGGALAGAGFMASLGLVPAYLLITALYLLGSALTARSGRAAALAASDAQPSMLKAEPAVGPSAFSDLKEGLLHVWHTPQLRAAMSLAALVNLCVFPLSGGLMPYIARDVFQLDQRGLGWQVASYASGCLLGSLALSTWGPRLRPGRTMLVTCLLWHLCLLGLALPVNVLTAQVLYLVAGFNQSLSMVALSLLLMRNAPERLRGRVMGLRMLAIYTLPLGLLSAGPLLMHMNFQGLVVLYVGLGLVLTGVVAFVWRHELLPLDARANAR